MLTLMRKPGAEMVRVPLNKWAEYRKAGYVFCNDEAPAPDTATPIIDEEAAAEVESPGAEAEAEPEKASGRRKTAPKK